ncbi:Histone-lysine N-methyltransferase SETMAR [Eumeta japonica]|uniref:Histone-lysine N-methyltransferase SETMAR n=1 Tax=Eumeta variegata TaxID=151549 RepID=A0A4C1X7H9_EUMVA|nr:Histone-lysine N-methyltransferase SETMAR [Eumeta japonica]
MNSGVGRLFRVLILNPDNWRIEYETSRIRLLACSRQKVKPLASDTAPDLLGKALEILAFTYSFARVNVEIILYLCRLAIDNSNVQDSSTSIWDRNCDQDRDQDYKHKWRILDYAHDPKTKQQSTVWVFQGEPKSTKGILAKSTLKQMVACFFGINGHMVTVPLENRKIVNSEWYATICLPEVFEEIAKNNRQRRIILHHDDASCHTSAETTRFLEGQKIKLTGHPPYSFNLAPNDFYLFPSVKNKLHGQPFSSRKEAVDAFKMYILEIPQSE